MLCLVLGRSVPGRTDGPGRGGRRGGQVHGRGRSAGQDRDRAGTAGDRGDAAAPADLTPPRHDLGNVDRVAPVVMRLVTRHPERPAQGRGV